MIQTSEITELKEFFNNAELPISIKMGSVFINDTRKMIDSHFELVEANMDKRFALAYWDRLKELKKILV